MGTILFFEDDDAFAKKTRSSLSKKVGSSVEVKLAKTILSKSENHKGKSFVHRLFNELKGQKNIDLIVADVNLYDIESYRGLSAEVVSEVAKQLFIPICIYSRNVPSDFERIQESIDASVKLKKEPDTPEMLTEIMYLHDGFVKTKKLYNRLSKKTKSESLPRILATILDRPQDVDRFSLYGLGNQGFLRFTPVKLKRMDRALRTKTVPYLLGNWLLLSVLKFPGILLNEVAVASHLNVSENDFGKSDVRNVFKRAMYDGPFSGLGPFWWRPELDDILDRAKASSGLELARKKTRRDVKPCRCSVDPKLEAGYYCIVTHRPVSLERSTSEISGIPKGADLARVSKPVYDKLKPWIGII